MTSAATAEVKWAINEGFAYLPDLGVKVSATRLFNAAELNLTALGVDLGIGKQFALRVRRIAHRTRALRRALGHARLLEGHLRDAQRSDEGA